MPSPSPAWWSTEALGSQGVRHRLTCGGAPVSWREFVRRLIAEPSFRQGLTARLAASEHEAFYWETPPVGATTAERPFEMVVLPAGRLARAEPSARAFEEHLEACPTSVCSFPNLRADARLVVPCALGPHEAYGHLAAFVRGAPAEQIDALWRRVGQAVDAWWSSQEHPVWVSTAGDGVPWLHVRLDQRPKYYKHRDYRDRPE